MKNKICTIISNVLAILVLGGLCWSIIKIFTFIEWLAIIALMFIGGWLMLFCVGVIVVQDDE